MRAKGQVVRAAFLAAVAVQVLACGKDVTNIYDYQDQWQASGPIIKKDTSQSGNCVLTLAGVGLVNVRNDTVFFPAAGATADVESHASGITCQSQNFRYESTNPTIAAVVNIDSITGHITAEGPGTALLYSIYLPTRDTLKFWATVGSASTCSLTSLSSTAGTNTLTVGQTTQITTSITSNPAGCASVSYSATGSVTVSQSGLVTAVSVGTGTVTVTPSVGTPITLNFSVNGAVLVVNPSSITQTNCAGAQQSWTISVTTSNGNAVAVTSSSSSNPTVASANGTNLLLTGSAGTATITVNTALGSVQIPVSITCSPVVLTPGFISVTNCPGYQASWPITARFNNGSVAVSSMSSSNLAVATTNGSTVNLTGTAGTAVITVTTASGTATLNVTVTQCNQARVDSVTLTPKVWNLTVGGPDVTLTATVWGTPGISQAVTYGNSQPGCATITANGNQVIVHALMACSNVVISATSVADVSKTGTSVGTIGSGLITCTVTDSTTGANISGTTVVMPAGVNRYPVIVTCTNQFGTQFRPWGESNHPEIADIVGSSSINIGGVNWPAGPYFTVTRSGAGTATLTFHAAVTDQTVLTSFNITFP